MLENKLSYALVHAHAQVFKNIATFHKFEWLEETVTWMSELQM